MPSLSCCDFTIKEVLHSKYIDQQVYLPYSYCAGACMLLPTYVPTTQTATLPQSTQFTVPIPSFCLYGQSSTPILVYLTMHGYSYLVFCLLCISNKASLPTLVYYAYLVWLFSGLVCYAWLPVVSSGYTYIVCFMCIRIYILQLSMPTYSIIYTQLLFMTMYSGLVFYYMYVYLSPVCLPSLLYQ